MKMTMWKFWPWWRRWDDASSSTSSGVKTRPTEVPFSKNHQKQKKKSIVQKQAKRGQSPAWWGFLQDEQRKRISNNNVYLYISKYKYIGYNHNTYHHYGRSGGYRRYRRRRRCGKCVTGGCGQDDEDDHHGRAATETMGEHHHPLLVVDYLCVREREIYIYICRWYWR